MTLVFPEGKGESNNIPAWPVDRLGRLVVIAAAHRAGDKDSIPGPGENFFS